ncbi:hypothetical protein GF340_02330 [Candidatus Peregrinibacteria bacterium]|nr:hypothetical protein [Candidatus Peregrinibacteria bacterium]
MRESHPDSLQLNDVDDPAEQPTAVININSEQNTFPPPVSSIPPASEEVTVASTHQNLEANARKSSQMMLKQPKSSVRRTRRDSYKRLTSVMGKELPFPHDHSDGTENITQSERQSAKLYIGQIQRLMSELPIFLQDLNGMTFNELDNDVDEYQRSHSLPVHKRQAEKEMGKYQKRLRILKKYGDQIIALSQSYAQDNEQNWLDKQLSLVLSPAKVKRRKTQLKAELKGLIRGAFMEMMLPYDPETDRACVKWAEVPEMPECPDLNTQPINGEYPREFVSKLSETAGHLTYMYQIVNKELHNAKRIISTSKERCDAIYDFIKRRHNELEKGISESDSTAEICDHFYKKFAKWYKKLGLDMPESV